MRGVVNRRVVQEQQVLVGPSATDVEAAVAFSCGLNAREELDRLEHVYFAHQGRQPLNRGNGHFGLAEVGALGVLPGSANHFCRIHGDGLRGQGHIPVFVLVAGEGLGGGLVADE